MAYTKTLDTENSVPAEAGNARQRKLPLSLLVALVVGSILGSGIFGAEADLFLCKIRLFYGSINGLPAPCNTLFFIIES